MNTTEILRGQEVEDIVTGFKGIAQIRTEYIHGCPRISVQPPVDKDGKVPEEQSFDETQLKVTNKKRIMTADAPPQRLLFGQKCKDPITEYEGIVIARAIHLNGCPKIAIQPKVNKEKKHFTGVWFDEDQLISLEKKPSIKSDKTPHMKRTGGPRIDPSARRNRV